MKKISLFLLAASFVTSCQPESTSNQKAPKTTQNNPLITQINGANISDTTIPVVLRDAELSTLASLIQTANLVDFFQGTGPFTSFAPSNDAFAKFDQSKLESLKDPANLDELVDFINYHVILGTYPSHNLKSCTKRTVNGKDITIKVDGDQIWVNEAKVTKKDLMGPNGVTYVVDTVLVP